MRCKMSPSSTITRAETLKQVALESESLGDFGQNLRDWQHEIQRSGVHSRKELERRIADKPPLLSKRFERGDVADAYLAAYAEWLADKAGVPRPKWCSDRRIRAHTPWFSSPDRRTLLLRTPASFRQRDIFTIPEPVFSARRGRPGVPDAQKRQKAILRQRTYRARIRALVNNARALKL